MDKPHASHRCEVCGEATELAVTEIVAPRGVVVTRHYCKAHWPLDDPGVSFKKDVDTSVTELKAKIRKLAKLAELLGERDRRSDPDAQ